MLQPATAKLCWRVRHIAGQPHLQLSVASLLVLVCRDAPNRLIVRRPPAVSALTEVRAIRRFIVAPWPESGGKCGRRMNSVAWVRGR